jgi:hypothetical protein
MGRRTSIAGAAASSAVKCAALALILINATPSEITEHRADCPQCQVVTTR